MKHINSFQKFLEDEVNLNPNRVERIKDGIETVETFIKNSDVFKNYFVRIVPQGSYRQKTIIKPLIGEGDFDADILLELKEIEGWSPKRYLEALHDEFKNTERYKDIVDRRGKTRCVTLDYADDFHIDIIPSIQRGDGSVIMNKTTDQFEPTDGDGYALWFERTNTISTNDFLIHVVRMTKYLRDREGIPMKSVMLTTIMGGLVLNSTRDLYSDLPTAFKVLFGRLDEYLQSHVSPPVVKNPVLPSESFTRHWDQESFEEARDKVRDLRIKVEEAYAEADPETSIKLWQDVFGDAFPSDAGLIPGLLPRTQNAVARRDEGEMFLSDLNISENIKYSVAINANVTQNGFRAFLLKNTNWPIAKKRKLKFIIEKCTVPEPYSVKWKIKNTGAEAISRDALRGEIIDDIGYRTRDESSLYEGEHYVECYVIKDGVCVAKDKLEVPIGRGE